MDLLIWGLYIFGYITIGFISSIIFTRSAYQTELEKPHTPALRKNRGGPLYSDEELEANETERRAKLAKKATKSGFWSGLFWPLMWIAGLTVGTVMVVHGLINTFAIKPVDHARVSEIEFKRAERIIAKYHEEEKEKFDRQLEGKK